MTFFRKCSPAQRWVIGDKETQANLELGLARMDAEKGQKGKGDQLVHKGIVETSRFELLGGCKWG